RLARAPVRPFDIPGGSGRTSISRGVRLSSPSPAPAQPAFSALDTPTRVAPHRRHTPRPGRRPALTGPFPGRRRRAPRRGTGRSWAGSPDSAGRILPCEKTGRAPSRGAFFFLRPVQLAEQPGAGEGPPSLHSIFSISSISARADAGLSSGFLASKRITS